ncbi:MAG: hypothetical protein AAGJ68_04205 [Pseudomonadota bacterium]
MRTPKTLFAALICTAAVAVSPAFASEAPIVEIQVDLDASVEEIYDSIREQTWTACKPEKVTNYYASRMSVRRACQKAMIADVVEALSYPEVMALAVKDGKYKDS